MERLSIPNRSPEQDFALRARADPMCESSQIEAVALQARSVPVWMTRATPVKGELR